MTTRTDVGLLYGDLPLLTLSLVVPGLLLTLGLVLYVRAVSDEVGYRKPPIDNMPAFQYSYSWSFCFAAIALVSTNIVAVANVYLYQGGYLDVIAPSTSLGMGSAGSEVSFEGAVVIVH
ncbi:hypothetical protein NP493_4989g00004 [Ridgeia piscesae]|uniref:Uncharacterized protein n=1 Tax=Ridgeia piscesae TaxID=27915 RepID=A0AAD9IXZ5_RIDPI|nr:hypothetical protein NP493_4989g00005 [Ridgeia piscesae]KAK2142146.1 hypothetical protein NP493_4989g00004 [Ridgeia piscesae]